VVIEDGSVNPTSRASQTAPVVVQEILGTYLRREQGLTKSFLQLRVEALRSADDGAMDDLVKHLESRELAQGFEIEVLICPLRHGCMTFGSGVRARDKS